MLLRRQTGEFSCKPLNQKGEVNAQYSRVMVTGLLKSVILARYVVIRQGWPDGRRVGKKVADGSEAEWGAF